MTNITEEQIREAALRIFAEVGVQSTPEEVRPLLSDDDAVLKLRWALEAVEAAIKWAMSQDQWVAVSEMLPDIDERVLVLDDGYAEIANYRIDRVFGDGRGKPCFINEQDEQPSILHPTHWQPLPSPPKKGADYE